MRALDDTIALLRPEFAGRVEVTLACDAAPRIYAYKAELGQVFMNLLRNAVEAIDGSGSVTIRLAMDDSTIRVSFTDTGRGIPAEHLPHIFTPGFSTQASRVKASLSLFTCMNIVRKHGGEIEVESAAGRGSTFTVLLPRRLERADARLEAGR